MVTLQASNGHDSGDFSARKADMIDKHVGQRLRDRRRILDLSQQDIAQILGISYQQVQKYECGLNRISAGRLFILGHIMRVPVTYFYEGLPPADEMLSERLELSDLALPELGEMPATGVQSALNDLVRALRDSKMM